MALAFIDRTPPKYDGGEFDKDSTVQEIMKLRSHIQEMSNYMAYMREVQNYNLNQQGAVSSAPAGGEEGNNG